MHTTKVRTPENTIVKKKIMSNQPKFLLWQGNEPHGKGELAGVTHAVRMQHCLTAFVTKKTEKP